jgi:hypothetical protein
MPMNFKPLLNPGRTCLEIEFERNRRDRAGTTIKMKLFTVRMRGEQIKHELANRFLHENINSSFALLASIYPLAGARVSMLMPT